MLENPMKREGGRVVLANKKKKTPARQVASKSKGTVVKGKLKREA